MKKPSFFTKIVASTAICALFASSVSAMSAVGNVEVPRGTPTIDGKISDGEWDGAGVVNFSSSTAKAWVGAVPGDFNTDVKVFWDEKGLYLAGEVVDSTFVASNEGSYDGDAFQVSIDLGQTFYDTDNSRAIFYSFGCNETNPIVQRQESANDAVMHNGEGVYISTVKTTKGWNFELMLEWSTLNADLQAKAGTTVNITKGTKINMMMCYLDHGTDGQITNAFGTTRTGNDVEYDWGPADHGITLTLGEKIEAPVDAPAPATADITSVAVISLAAAGALFVCVRAKKH